MLSDRTGNLIIRKAMRAFDGRTVVGLKTPSVRDDRVLLLYATRY